MGSLYQFGQFVLDPSRRALTLSDSPVSLTPKAFDVLLYLVQNPNRLVTKDELMQAVWADTFVEEGNLKQYISHLRKVLGDSSEEPSLIVTIPRKGYQFTMVVTVAESAEIVNQAAFQSPSSENSPSTRLPDVLNLTDEAVPRTSRGSRRTVFLTASIVLVVGLGFASWHQFLRSAQPRSQKIMLAVLPFENLTGDQNKEYLADGLTEEMISQLGQLNPEKLGVIARTSVMGYKHKEERLDQIGHDLSVQYVLENSIRESGNHMRLTSQLIQVRDQTHLWSQDYDYTVNDSLTVEDRVANAVVQQIRVRLGSQQQTELPQSHAVVPEAFNAYLQGYYYFERDSDNDTNMAAKYFEHATEVDPNYALAWVGLSRARNWQAVTGLIPSEEGHRLAREAVKRALALNPNLAEAHIQMARLQRQLDFDWAGMDASVKRAIALDPGNPEIIRFAAASAAILGRTDEALTLARRAIDLDPLNAHSWSEVGEIEFYCDKLSEAEKDFKRANELRSDESLSAVFLSETYLMEGRPQVALPEIQHVQYEWVRLFLSALAYHALGQEKESDAALRELTTKYQEIGPYQIAEIYAFRNQPDDAFTWLNRTYPKHDDEIFMKVDPLLKSLHSDQRYYAFLKKLNLPN